MKIVLVGTFVGIESVPNFWASTPSTDWKFSKGFRDLGHEVIEVNCLNVAPNVAVNNLMQAFIQKPDVVVFGNVFGFLRPYIVRIFDTAKGLNVKTIIWHGDVRERPEKIVIDAAKRCTAFFLTSSGEMLRDYKTRARLKIAAWIFNPCVNHEIANPPTHSDVLFTGCTGPSGIIGNYDGLRDDIINYLPMYCETKKKVLYMAGYNTDRIIGRDYISAIKGAVVGLGINRFVNVDKYASERMSDYISNGTLYLGNNNPGLEKIFKGGKHCLYFKTKDECFKKLDEVFEMTYEQRFEIRKEGQKWALENFSPKEIAEYMLEVTLTGESKKWWADII